MVQISVILLPTWRSLRNGRLAWARGCISARFTVVASTPLGAPLGTRIACILPRCSYDLDSNNGANGDQFVSMTQNYSAYIPTHFCPGNHVSARRQLPGEVTTIGTPAGCRLCDIALHGELPSHHISSPHVVALYVRRRTRTTSASTSAASMTCRCRRRPPAQLPRRRQLPCCRLGRRRLPCRLTPCTTP